MVTRIIVFSLLSILSSTGVALENTPWFAFGDLRGHFEPCGCDPATDLGGVPRLDAYLNRERSLHPEAKIFHLGNAYSSLLTNQKEQKNNSIRSALSVISPDASLLNRAELLYGAKALPSIKYVLSNHSSKSPSALKYFPSIDLGTSTVFGIVEPFPGYKNLEKFDAAHWTRKKKLAAKTTPARWILLYSGSKKTLQRIVKANVFDEIISSNDWPDEKEFGDEERRDEKKLIALNENAFEVLKVPLGGQGVIRSLSLQTIPPAKPLALALSSDSTRLPSVACAPNVAGIVGRSDCQSKDGATSLLSRTFVVWLGKDQESGISADMKQVIARSRDAAAAAMTAHITKKSEELKTTNFIGADACKSCHESAYKVWESSKHALALATIKRVERLADPECVSCHVLGFHEKGGFASEELSPQFSNVQCENCHGPRKDHAANPTVKSKVKIDANASCAECHTPPHSPRFEFKSYWETIAH